MPAPAYAFAVFLGAFLLFQVQPLLGRYILPWFGGGPSVWTSCLLFFQALLLAGYAYAHGVASRLTPKWQGRLHMGLLLVSLFALPIDPDAEVWTGQSYDNPTGTIMLLLLVTAGLPYVILSATSPLLQRWFHWRHPDRSAYRLYALSNAGSLLALLSYPFVVEPLAPVRLQAEMWSWAYAAFVLACGWCAWGVSRRVAARPEPEAEEDGPPPTASELGWWLALSACGSALLMATTNQMSQEVAVVPFLWVLPLSLYLLSFILCFESDRWYRRRPWAFVLALTVPMACVMLATGGVAPLGVQIAVFSATLFAGCMACHGELALARPHGRHATMFYLILALGGAVGGLFVAVLAPRMFPAYWEYPLSLAAACLLTLYLGVRRGGWSLSPAGGAFAPPPALLLALFAVGYTFSVQAAAPHLAVSRNFYGVLQVTSAEDANGPLRKLTHGRTEHGAQYLDARRRFLPTMYFGAGTGAELAFQQHPARKAGKPLRVGVVGLGAGTLAAYGRSGDVFRFYEINPAVIEFARTQFSYLSDSPAKSEIVPGDARVRMEEELEAGHPGRFDILVVDAFSSGAIPLHLLTGEAGEIYAQHLKENGLLVFHITNRFLDLTPVLTGMAQRLGMTALRVESTPKPELGVSAATWMILTRNQEFLRDPVVLACAEVESGADSLDWTDNFAGLWQALR
ncbi:MAG: fused MFS/spermidine synthase [Bryobacterales bacterium]